MIRLLGYRNGGTEVSGGLAVGIGPGSRGEGIGGGSFVFTLGDGKGVFVGGLFVFWFEFSSATFEFVLLLTTTGGEIVGSAFALAFAFSFALTARDVVAPPEGISASDVPVAGGEGSTAWLLGSATRPG